MKNELIQFNKKNVEYIKKNYKYNGIKKDNSEFSQNLHSTMEYYKKVSEYKRMIDDKKIELKDIPDEYLDDIKNLYLEEINKIKNKIKNE